MVPAHTPRKTSATRAWTSGSPSGSCSPSARTPNEEIQPCGVRPVRRSRTGRSSTTVTPRCSSSGMTSDSTSAPPVRYSLIRASVIAGRAAPTGWRGRPRERAPRGRRRRRPRRAPSTSNWYAAGNASRQRRYASTPASSPRASTNASWRSSTHVAHERRELAPRPRADRRAGAPSGVVDHDVQARHHRLGEQQVEVDVAPAERDAAASSSTCMPHAGRVAVAREVHQARHEAAELVVAHEEPHPPAQAHAHDAGRELGQLVDAEAEQLVARVALEHVRQRAPVVARGREARPLDHLGDLLAQQRDRLGRLAVDVGGVEAERSASRPGTMPSACDPADVHAVEGHVAVDGRTRQGLGEHEHPRRVAPIDVALANQRTAPGHAELGPGDDHARRRRPAPRRRT